MSSKPEFDILYEDQDIVAINKPAGVVVNQAESIAQPTVQEWMRHHIVQLPEVSEQEWQRQVPSDFDSTYGEPLDIFVQRAGMVHRLDKNTSGVLLLAKHPGSLVNLLAQFRERKVTKEYMCLVHGLVSTSSGVVDAPLARSSRDRKKFAVVEGGRPAVTDFIVEQQYAGLIVEKLNDILGANEAKAFLQRSERVYQGFSLVRCFPKTGRTHQIRVHMAHLQHPLVGDTTYLGKKRQKLDPVWCQRHFLHAQKISFLHPRTNVVVEISAELTEDLLQVQSLLSPL